MKKIFLVNDDGYKSPGLLAIVKALENDYDLSVVSTLNQRSWTAKSISYKKSVLQTEGKISGQKVIIIDGLPADCSNIGLNHFTKPKAELVISGINIGANITNSWTLSSATVGACLEAAILGYPAIALSQRLPSSAIFDELINNPQPTQEKYFKLASQMGKLIVERVLRHPFPKNIKVLNINFPTEEKYTGKWLLAKPYNWNYGSIFTSSKKGVWQKTGGENIRNQVITDKTTDVWQINNGYISITPYDLPLCPVWDKETEKYFAKVFPEFF